MWWCTPITPEHRRQKFGKFEANPGYMARPCLKTNMESWKRPGTGTSLPVILATWEAEIRRINVQGQSGKQVTRPL
jgi:hypothetical protein